MATSLDAAPIAKSIKKSFALLPENWRRKLEYSNPVTAISSVQLPFVFADALEDTSVGNVALVSSPKRSKREPS